MKILKPIAIAAITTFIAVGCSKDDNDDLVITDPEAEFAAELLVTEDNVADNRTVMITADGTTMATIKAKVRFESTTNKMRRLYITQNVSGTGEEPFVFTSQEVDEKPDGSLDLVGDDKNEFEFQIDLPAPSVANGDIVYTFWSTTGRGDFRDVTKRNALGDTALGTITIKFGTGVNSANGMNAFSAVILSAPLGDGSSKTFISLFNSEIYKISDGEETAALWDFGYYYGNTNKASLASTSSYPKLFDHDDDDDPNDLVAVSVLTGVAQAELNNFYITTSSLDFDAIASASDLDGIIQPSSESVTNLSEGNVLEFVDAYGNKGVIKVTEISGTFGTDDFIKIDVKVQN